MNSGAKEHVIKLLLLVYAIQYTLGQIVQYHMMRRIFGIM
jgi:hypothetical protein